MSTPWPALRFFQNSLPIRVTQNRLPHWQQEGASFFITFRLADSLPESILGPWRQAKALWLHEHPEPWDTPTETAYHREFSAALDGFLDAGHGSCLLRDPDCAKITAGALLHFDTDR